MTLNFVLEEIRSEDEEHENGSMTDEKGIE